MKEIHVVKKCSTTLLLVEDEVLIALETQHQLNEYGYNIIHVRTGHEAISMLKEKNDIDLILMDIDLDDGINGIETAEMIQKNMDIPIIFVSSYNKSEIYRKIKKIRYNSYVRKDSSISVLNSSIMTALKSIKN